MEHIVKSIGEETVDGEEETIDGEEETVDGEEKTVDGEEETVDGEEKTVDGEEETVDEHIDDNIDNEKYDIFIKLLSDVLSKLSQIKNINILTDKILSFNELIHKVNNKTSYEQNIYGNESLNSFDTLCEISSKSNLIIPMMDSSDATVSYYLLYRLIDESVLICTEFSHPNFWNYISTKNKNVDDITHDILNVTKYYNPTEYSNEDNKLKIVRAFIGTEQMINMNVNDFMENMMLSEWLELFTWTTNDIDHPFRETLLNEKLSAYQYNKMNISVNQQHAENIKIVNTRTRYSKTLMSFEILRDGLFIVTIYYVPIKCKRLKTSNNCDVGKKYNDDLPIDVIQSIIDMPFIKYDEILQLEPLTIHNCAIANMLSRNDIDKQKIICEQICDIIKKYDETNWSVEDDIMCSIKQLIYMYKINIIISKFYDAINENSINKYALKAIIKTNLEDLNEKYFNVNEIKQNALLYVSKIIEETKCKIIK